MGIIYVGTRFSTPTVALPGELTTPLKELLAKPLPLG
jgi:hypothetical protein